MSFRTPKPGDPGFVQCRCAEKRAPQRNAATFAQRLPIFIPADEGPQIDSTRLDPAAGVYTISEGVSPALTRTLFHPPDLA